jgi:conjugative coupling factor TraD (TOL family)
MDLGERVGHTLVLGTTRVGKTRLAELLITQDIRRGDVVIVFDPKGDADLLRRIYAEAKRAGRLDDFYLFHLGFPELSARYNAIGNFSRITEVATRIANQLPNEGNSAAFKEFAWRFVNIIARALVALKRRPDYQQIRRYINDIEPLFVEYAGHCAEVAGIDAWASLVEERAADIKERNLPNALRGRSMEAIACMRLLQERAIYDPVLDGLISAFKYDKTYFDKIVSSVGPLMEKLTTGTIAALISPDYQDEQDARPIFEWMEVVRRKGIVYVGLDALTDTTVASAVGNSMFADLVSVAGTIYKHGVVAPGSDYVTPGKRATDAAHHLVARGRVQRADRRRVRAAVEQGRWRRLSGHGLYPDLVGRGGADRQPRQSRAGGRQLQYDADAAGERAGYRRDADRAVAPGGGLHPDECLRCR